MRLRRACLPQGRGTASKHALSPCCLFSLFLFSSLSPPCTYESSTHSGLKHYKCSLTEHGKGLSELTSRTYRWGRLTSGSPARGETGPVTPHCPQLGEEGPHPEDTESDGRLRPDLGDNVPNLSDFLLGNRVDEFRFSMGNRIHLFIIHVFIHSFNRICQAHVGF